MRRFWLTDTGAIRFFEVWCFVEFVMNMYHRGLLSLLLVQLVGTS